MPARPSPPPGTVDVDAVLFDMDGTLVDSTSVVERLWQQFAARFGIDADELLAYAHGRQTRDTVAHFLPPGHDPQDVTAAFERRELVETDGITAVPGAPELLARLDRCPVAVVTSAPRALAEVRLAAAGVPAPPTLVPSEDVVRGKPDPEGYRTAARLLGVDPARCLVVEDAEAGIRAGLAAGARTLVVGHHRSSTTRELPRVVDLTSVTATRVDGHLRISWERRTDAHPA